MIPLTLAELAEATDAVLHTPEPLSADTLVNGPVAVDSRLVTTGSIFVCQRGETTDGHLFAPSAVTAGAAVLIVERILDSAGGVPQLVVDDAHEALARLARHVVDAVRRTGELTVVAVTGSNGKTTTKNMLRAILEPHGTTVAPQGSFNNHVGAPLSMLQVSHDTRYLIVELGAAGPGEIARLAALAPPDVAVVLTVGLAHIGGFGDVTTTRNSKAELVHAVRDGGMAILGVDSPPVASMVAEASGPVVTFGLSDGVDVQATDVTGDLDRTTFTLVADGTSSPVRLRILGEHHVTNALASLAVARELRIPRDDAIAALEALTAYERHRMEVARTPRDITIINDAYNASPDSMAAALKTLAQVTRGQHRAVAILGEMAELGDYADAEHDRIGRLVVRLGIEKLYVVGDAARHIHNAAGLEGSWDGESVLVDSVDEAYDHLRDELRKGDVVLVKSSNSAGLRHLGDRLVEALGTA